MKSFALLTSLLIALNCISQSDVAGPFLGHQRIAGRYVGWSPTPLGSVSGSLDIRNDFPAQPINFFSGGSPLIRMTILGNGRSCFNTTIPLLLGSALDAQVTINSGNANGVFATTSNGLNPRIYFESRNSAPGNDHAICHSVPSGFFPVISQATSGIVWNNINFATFQSNFNINSRTTAYGGFNALTVEQNFGRVGINNSSAQNRMEITSKVSDPYFASVNGSSGLRFTNMTTANTPVPLAVGQGVLSVDANGDVVYVTGANNLGGLCANPDNPITGDYKIPLNDFNFHFNDNGSTAPRNNVGIGTNCGSLVARLQVENPVMLYGIHASTTTSGPLTNYGIFGSSSNAIITSIGVHGEAINSGPVFNMGVHGHATNATQTNYGGYFEADGSASSNIGVQAIGAASSSSSTVFGINANSTAAGFGIPSQAGRFDATGSTSQNAGVVGRGIFVSATSNNYGGAFQAGGGLNNYAVYGQVSTAGAPGPGFPTGPNYAGYFLGDVYISGTYGPSDVNMKENIYSINNADSLLNLMLPKYFSYKQTGQWAWLNLQHGKQAGLIAQDIETILPSFVKLNHFPGEYDSLGNVIQAPFDFKTIDYDKFVPILISGYKNLKSENLKQDSLINVLINQNADIINCLNNANLCNESRTQQNSTTSNQINIELTDVKSIILDQNVPNPWAEQTTITFSLTEGVQKAQMLFYNSEGRLINSTDLVAKSGKGQLNVFANDLTNGVYTYTLVVDGKIIDTKRMVKNK